MKKDIHPEYHAVAITCVCGTTWNTKSTSKNIRMDICSACHPFYTGKQKVLDTEGRIDKFNRKYAKK